MKKLDDLATQDLALFMDLGAFVMHHDLKMATDSKYDVAAGERYIENKKKEIKSKFPQYVTVESPINVEVAA